MTFKKLAQNMEKMEEKSEGKKHEAGESKAEEKTEHILTKQEKDFLRKIVKEKSVAVMEFLDSM